MAMKLGVLVLSILVCKIQSQAVEINTNLHYSQFSSYPSFVQTPPTAQPATPTPVPVASPSPPLAPVALPLQQYLTFPVPTLPAQPCSAPVAQPCSAPVAQPPPPVAVNLPPQQYLTSPITLPAQPYLSAPVAQPPVAVTLPTQPKPPTVTLPPPVSIPGPQPVFIPHPPPTITFQPPPPTFQISPPPPIPILPPSVQISPPPPIAIQELPVSVNVPVIPSLPNVPLPVMVPSPIPMISTTVVDNSLANKLANVLQLLLFSNPMEANMNPYCTSPFLNDVTFYDSIGTIGTIYSPEVVTAPFYTPAYGVTDIIPSIFGVEPFGTVTEIVTNVGAVSEVFSPFGDFYTYSPLTTELLLPNQMVYNLPQLVEPALEQIVYF